MSSPNEYQRERGYREERIQGPAYYALIALFVAMVYVVVWAMGPQP